MTLTSRIPDLDMPKDGLGVLYARPNLEMNRICIPEREVPGDLREKYWIDKVRNYKPTKGPCHVEVRFQLPVEREDFGRTRNDSVNGFGYSVGISTSGIETSMDWFEVVEVFTTVPPKDVQSFMKHINELPVKSGFDVRRFLDKLNLDMPKGMDQCRAADKVLQAVERKLCHTPYKITKDAYGYGTLVVGLPLWFATPPLNSLRHENTLDDFMNRTSIGLNLIRERQLSKKYCPFQRVVGVWDCTREAMRHWVLQANLAVYDDPANLTLTNPFKWTPWVQTLTDVTTSQYKELPSCTFILQCKCRWKKARFMHVPPVVAELEKNLAG